MEYFLDLFGTHDPNPVVAVVDALTFEVVAAVPVTFTGQTMAFDIPLEALGVRRRPDRHGDGPRRLLGPQRLGAGHRPRHHRAVQRCRLADPGPGDGRGGGRRQPGHQRRARQPDPLPRRVPRPARAGHERAALGAGRGRRDPERGAPRHVRRGLRHASATPTAAIRSPGRPSRSMPSGRRARRSTSSRRATPTGPTRSSGRPVPGRPTFTKDGYVPVAQDLEIVSGVSTPGADVTLHKIQPHASLGGDTEPSFLLPAERQVHRDRGPGQSRGPRRPALHRR